MVTIQPKVYGLKPVTTAEVRILSDYSANPLYMTTRYDTVWLTEREYPMSLKGWLPIAEYAGKYRVSISTLRRRIKGGDIEYSFSDGKYFLRDLPLGQQALTQQSAAEQVTTAPPPQSGSPAVSEPMPNLPLSADAGESDSKSNVLATTNRILDELKKAYSLILQEKEQQITQLRAEAADLKTLVRVLESENERLRGEQSLSSSVDLDLDKEDWLLES